MARPQPTNRPAGATRWTKTTTKFNADNLPTEVDDLGDETDAKDDRCTTTEYARNESAWILDRVRQVKKLDVRCGTSNVPTERCSTV